MPWRNDGDMSEISDRYRRIAAAFTARVEGVEDGAWDNPAPCEGWVARDVVRHLVEWGPAMLFDNWEIERPEVPSVDQEPVAAWKAIDHAVQTALEDPEISSRVRDTQMGSNNFSSVTDMIWTGDVLIHTWDLARATGQDDSLDPELTARMYDGMQAMDEVLRSSGHFGPKVAVPDEADVQTKLIAFTGRRPDWSAEEDG